MKLKITLLSSLFWVSTVYAASVMLSPNFNAGQGQIPSGYADLTFQVSNGNWVNNISLPKTANGGDLLTISSRATYPSVIYTFNTDIPLPSLSLQNGQSYRFKFNAVQQQWQLQVDQLWPSSQGWNFTQSIVQVMQINDEQWASEIRLPQTAVDGTLIKIISNTSKVSKVNTDNLLFASSFNLRRGDVVWFKYYKELNKWVPESISARQIDVKDIGTNLTRVDAAVTQVNFSDANWQASLSLPKTAQDRDRIIVSSTAAWAAKINNSNIRSQASLSLKQGDRYEFVFIADLGKWIIDSSPIGKINSKALMPSQLADIQYPLTQVEINAQSWQAEFKLPNKAQVDDKIVLKSNATQVSFIRSRNGLKSILRPGETQRFVYRPTGWAVDSYSIDVLMVLHPEVINSLGESAAKVRLLAAMELTNLTAQNSSAQFYLRQAGVISSAVQGENLDKVVSNILDTPAIKNERDRVGADMVYYESKGPDPDYCGMAISAVEPKPDYMAAVGISSCSLAVMRHELGHNFGLQHHDENMQTIYRGFHHALGSTAMGGNSLDYYSSPSLYSPKYAVRLGEEGRIDAVALLNRNAPIIAQFKSANSM